MKLLPNRVRSHLKQHQLFWNLTGLAVVTAVLGLTLIYQEMHQKLNAYFEQIHQQKNFSQLQVFHRGMTFHFERILREYAGVADQLAKDTALRDVFAQKDRRQATQILEKERAGHEHLTGLSLLDANGTVFAVASVFPDGERYVGTSVASSEHIKKTLSEKKGVIVNVPRTISGRNVLFFTQPVLDQSGEILYVISASVTLDSLNQYLRPHVSLAEFDTLLVDAQGRVLFSTDALPVEEISLEHDRAIQVLLSTDRQSIEDQEINYKGEKVLVRGEKIFLGDGQFVVAVSFYPVTQSVVEGENLKYQVDSLFFGFVVRTGLVLAIFIFVLIWLIQRHEKLAHPQ